MWLYDKITDAIDSLNSDSDDAIDEFIDKTYYGLPQLSCLYLNWGKYRLRSLLQLTAYVLIVSFHWYILVGSTLKAINIDMVIFSQDTHFCLLIQLVLILITFIQTKHRQIALFHKMMASDFYDYGEELDIGEDALRSSVAQERRTITVIPVAVGIATSFVLVLSSVVDKNLGTFDFNRTADHLNNELPFAFGKYPYCTKDGVQYYSALLGQIVCACLVAIVIGTGGFLIIVACQSLALQLRLLHNSLDKIEGRAAHLCSQLFEHDITTNSNYYEEKNFVYCYSECLRKNFQHHQVILKGFKYLVEILSVPILLSYMTGTIVIALSLISTGSAKELPGTTIASLVLCGVEVGYMFLFSVFGQRFNDLSQQLRFKIYSIKWYNCNNEVKSNLRIFQAMTLKPLTVKVGGIVPANMETFATVMRSAYSYYNLVNVFSEN